LKQVQRRKTLAVDVDGVVIGGDAPVVVQSMTNTDTADVASTVEQVRLLADAGSELVRVTVNNDDAARAVPEIVARVRGEGYRTPIVGDFHYNGHLLLTKYPDTARALAKLRINPGNVGTKHRDANFTKIIEVALEHDKPIRIGVNWGSLDQRLLTELMDENAAREEPREAQAVLHEALVESALRSAALAEELGMASDLIVIST
jgi:(E)-4-hydroxy-3-methylbut-2-enyl-diphosphate synthase